MLIITNGDSAAEAIKEAGIQADSLPWRDILHEGPVPGSAAPEELNQIRAQFLSSLFGEPYPDTLALLQSRDRALQCLHKYDETVLWFEHDLYDQL